MPSLEEKQMEMRERQHPQRVPAPSQRKLKIEEHRLEYLARHNMLRCSRRAKVFYRGFRLQETSGQELPCDICGKIYPEPKLHVDYDHRTNYIRGLLCRSCNLLIGYANDDLSVIKNAFDYLSNRPKP